MLSDIVKRRSVRVLCSAQAECSSRTPALWRYRSTYGPQGLWFGGGADGVCWRLPDRERRRGDLEASWSFCQCCAPDPVGISEWALIMRTIKCLKGIRWMPWR